MTLLLPSRVTWLDTARGLTIILVVAFHAMRTLGNEDVASALVKLNYLLSAARMPAFFLVSGLVTAYGIQRAWPFFIEKRIAPTVWLFVVWGGILIGLSNLAAWPVEPIALSHLLTMWADPYVHMWFMRDLIVMALAARLLAAAPTAAIMPLAALYWLASEYEVFGGTLPASLFFFFLAGVRFQSLLLVVPERMPYLQVFGGGFICVMTAAALGIEAAKPVISIFGVAALLSFSVIADRWGPSRVVLSAVGSQSLAVYLLHLILMGNLVPYLPDGRIGGGWLLPITLTAFGVVGSMFIQRLLEWAGLGWLFSMPTVARADLKRAATP